MKINIGKYSLFLTAAACLLMMTACDTPVSFGARVNTEVPVIKTPDEGKIPGSFLNGAQNIIFLEVEQEYGIDDVYMTIQYFDLNGAKQIQTLPAYYDKSKGYYAINVDTIKMNMADGSIKTWVTAIDIAGKTTISTDIIYIVKNLPPQIEMSIPSIKGDDFDDPDYIMKGGLCSEEPVIVGFDLVGLATDDAGLLGIPEIQIWRIPSSTSGDLPPTDIGSGYQIDPDDVPWRKMVLPIVRDGLTTTRITWPMLKLVADASVPGGYRLPADKTERTGYLNNGDYGFRMRVKDVFGNINYYPNRDDNKAGPGGAKLPAKDPDNPELVHPDYPVKYIRFNYMLSEIPIAQITELESQNYNGINNFSGKARVSSTNPVSDVYLFVSNNEGGIAGPGGVNNGPKIQLTITPSQAPPTYDFDFTITKTDAAQWPTPIGGDFLYLHIVAEDSTGKQSPQAFRNFIFDTTPPTVKFERPFNIANPPITLPVNLYGEFSNTGTYYEIYRPSSTSPKWVTGNITIGGWANDPADGTPMSGVDKVYYHIGNLGDDATGVAHAARESIYNSAAWKDTKLDSIKPEDGWSGNLYTWSYTENFNNYKASNSDWQHAGAFGFSDGNWNYETNPNEYVNDATGTLGRDRFYLPFYVKVLDKAGNTKILHYKLCIDPYLDIPQVDINYPNEDDLVGGEVRLSGTASDNEWVHTVLIRIQKHDKDCALCKANENNPSYDYKTCTNYDHNYILPEAETAFFYSKPANAAFPGYNNDPSGWFEASTMSKDMVVGWYYNINSDSELDPEDDNLTVAVKIEARAIDSKDGVSADYRSLVGPVETRYVKFSAGVPTINEPVIKKTGSADREYSDGIRTAGTIRLAMHIRDDEALNLIRVTINGSPTAIVTNNVPNASLVTSGWTITGPYDDGKDHSRKNCFYVEIPVDTVAFSGGIGRTGSLRIDVLARDNSVPPLEKTSIYNLNIDNFYPFTATEFLPNASGTAFVLKGEAKDYKDDGTVTVQGLERMLVYFEDAEIHYTGGLSGKREIKGKNPKVFVNPRGVAVNGSDPFYNGTGIKVTDEYNTETTYYGNTFGRNEWATIPPMDSYNNVREDSTDTIISNFSYFPLLKAVNHGTAQMPVWTWESPHAMVIDSQEFGAYADLDNDGTFGEVWPKLVDKAWQVRMNTKYFNDGPLIVHFIVMDEAGNATHYEKPIFIENKRPVITEFNLGTDVDGAGNPRITPWTDSNSPGEYKKDFITVGKSSQTGNSEHSFGTVTSSYPSHQPFRVRNNQLAFRIRTEAKTGNSGKNYKISHVSPGDIKNANEMVKGKVYSIVTTANTDWLQYGAPVSAAGVVFVASVTTTGQLSSVTGTGTVKEYNHTVPEVQHTLTVNPADDVTLDDVTLTISSFSGANSGISDSTGINDRLFIVKVYDNTVGTVLVNDSPVAAPEEEQLAHAILVALTINNTDSIVPTITVSQFGTKYTATNWEDDKSKVSGPVSDYNENIVVSTGTVPAKLGYVQYAGAGHAGTGSPADISGRVKFLGKAEDNQRIRRIYVTIPGYDGDISETADKTNQPFMIAEMSSGNLISKRDETMGIGTGKEAWYFKIIENKLTLDYGHAINWEFAWDSSAVANQVGAPAITFTINDYSSSGNPNTSTINVNIAPYISEITTGLSGAYSSAPSAFARSANGWYPVREDETITVKGFNFGVNDGTTIVKINTTDNFTRHTTTTIPTSLPSNNYRVISSNEIRINVGTTATSGPLEVRVGSTIDTSRIASLNNLERSVKTVAYNMEPNNVNNNKLTNERNLFVWSTGYLINDAQVNTPFMRMDKNANRYVIFGRYFTGTSSNLKVIPNNQLMTNGVPTYSTTAATGTIESGQNRYLNPTIAVDSFGNTFAAGTNMTASAVSAFAFFGRTATPTSVTYAGSFNSANTNKRRLQLIDGNENRFRYPSISTQVTNPSSTATDSSGTYPTRVFMSHWVATSQTAIGTSPNYTNSGNLNPVLFYYGNLTNSSDRANYGGSFATADYDGTAGTNPTTTANNYGGAQVIVNNDNTYGDGGVSVTSGAARGGRFTAAGGFSNGLPVVVWYDDTNECLWMSHPATIPENAATANSTTYFSTNNRSNVLTHTTTASWQANYKKIIDSAGAYVNMAVDGDDNIHLAYYDVARGGLIYSLIGTKTITTGRVLNNTASPATNQTIKVPDYSNIQTVKVDTFLSAGLNIMLNVRKEGSNYVPYISYYHGSFPETRNTIRVAWRKNFTTPATVPAGTDNLDYFTRDWEVMTVPVGTIPVGTDYISSGTPTAGGSWADPYTTSTLIKKAATGFPDLSKSMVLGYKTQSHYEGAILKGDMTTMPKR